MRYQGIFSKSVLGTLLAVGALSLGSVGITAQAAEQNGDLQSDSQQKSSQQQTQKKSEDKKQSKSENKEQSESSNNQSKGNDQFITHQKSSQILASSIMGMSIKNKPSDDAEEIGTVNDLIMNKQHKLVGVVVGVGGFLGLGQKNVGIPWSAVKNIDTKKGVAVADVDKKQLENAPSFTTKEEQEQKQKQQQQQQQMKQQQQQQQQNQSGQGQGGGAGGSGNANG